MSDDELRRAGEQQEDETIPLSQERDAQFSGKTIFFPAREGGAPSGEESPEADPTRLPPAREPIDDRTGKPKRPFLSFFDAPETPDGSGAPSSDPDAGDAPAEEEEEDEAEEETLSFDEFVQKEHDEETREDLDNLIRQNDADSLFTLGRQYGEPAAAEPAEPAEGEEVSINPTSILEAMLFVGNRENKPLPIEKATSLMRNVTREDVLQSVEELNSRYTKTLAPYHILQTDGGLRLELRPEYETVRRHFFGKVRDAKLTQHQIDVLALVAYRQPISAAEIAEIRPQPGNILNALVKRNLIEITENGEPGGSPIYRTTPRLLKILGIGSISDLPIVDELDYR